MKVFNSALVTLEWVFIKVITEAYSEPSQISKIAPLDWLDTSVSWTTSVIDG